MCIRDSINMFLAPATACLAVSIYTRAELLKKNWLPIVVGASCGSLASMGSMSLIHIFGDNTHIENCIVESRDTIRANSFYRGEDEIKIVILVSSMASRPR